MPVADERMHAKKHAVKHAKKVHKKVDSEGPSTRKHTIKHKTPVSMPTRNIIAGAFVILLVLAAVVYMSGNQNGSVSAGTTTTTMKAQSTKSGVAQSGDTVTVEYTGSFENGTVFDTTDQAIAEENNILNPLRTYQPLTFTLGGGGFITGFEDAVVGMSVGEVKEVTLPPEKAYGYPQQKLIQNVERKQRSPAVQNVSIDKFKADIGVEPTVGLEFKVPNSTGYQLTWPMKVLAISNDTVTFRFLSGAETTMQTVFGDADVYTEGDEIVIEVNAIVGQRILTRVGPAKIVGVNDENITIDFNHDLAGKNLKFKIKLTDDIKQ